MAEAELSAAELNEQRFKELNLQEDVLAQYRKRFDALDLNKDGIVELREFAAVSRIFGYNLSKDAIMEIFGRKDIDDTGGITFVEFVVAMRRRAGKNQATGDIRGKFRQYDVKNRGYITADEAFPVLERELGFDLSKTEALVEKYDKNRDYRLSLLEFVEFQKKVEELKEQIVQAFYEFDTNNDGYVGLDEVNAKMLPKGCTPQQVEALFRQADKDQDNQLNYSEFAAFWDIPIN